MNFECAPEKSKANKAKHGIDFEEAQALWLDERLIEAPARTDDEPRYLVVGRIDGRHWSAVCVRRGDNVRIISVRRAREQEIEHYEGN
ncbi:BrnT family toxin [Shinella sp. BYT-45]|uniref:BrnT family toxin n=1 Tax=Shinella sp. BYT-45 TaxID=3377377 RepID=UPI0039818432